MWAETLLLHLRELLELNIYFNEDTLRTGKSKGGSLPGDSVCTAEFKLAQVQRPRLQRVHSWCRWVFTARQVAAVRTSVVLIVECTLHGSLGLFTVYSVHRCHTELPRRTRWQHNAPKHRSTSCRDLKSIVIPCEEKTHQIDSSPDTQRWQRQTGL